MYEYVVWIYISLCTKNTTSSSTTISLFTNKYVLLSVIGELLFQNFQIKICAFVRVYVGFASSHEIAFSTFYFLRTQLLCKGIVRWALCKVNQLPTRLLVPLSSPGTDRIPIYTGRRVWPVLSTQCPYLFYAVTTVVM